MNRWSTGAVWGNETILYDEAVEDMCIMHLLKSIDLQCKGEP